MQVRVFCVSCLFWAEQNRLKDARQLWFKQFGTAKCAFYK